MKKRYLLLVHINLKKENEVGLVVWDTSGQERFRSLAFKTMKNIDVIVLVFDVTNRKSFENIACWLSLIKENTENKPHVILFWNKSDVEKEKWNSKEEIKQCVKKAKLDYFEISAIKNQGINEGLSYFTNNLYDKLEEKKKNYNAY